MRRLALVRVSFPANRRIQPRHTGFNLSVAFVVEELPELPVPPAEEGIADQIICVILACDGALVLSLGASFDRLLAHTSARDSHQRENGTVRIDRGTSA